MKYVYKTQGTCSTNIELEVENNIVKEVAFWGGCNALLHVPTNYAVLCTRWVSKKNKGCI